jgi:hypothetical protein
MDDSRDAVLPGPRLAHEEHRVDELRIAHRAFDDLTRLRPRYVLALDDVDLLRQPVALGDRRAGGVPVLGGRPHALEPLVGALEKLRRPNIAIDRRGLANVANGSVAVVLFERMAERL